MIRKAKLNDFKGVLNAFREAQDLHAMNEPNIFKFVDPIDFKTFKEMFNNKDIIILVSENELIIEGFLIATIKEIGSNLTLDRKLMIIENLAVLKSRQRQHIGKFLINEIKRIADREKCDGLILNVWCFNDNARSFYKHLGFKEKSIKMELEI
ncbi:MAG TPA: hypothetical protein DCE23_07130 [Firmicutes bacterium]|nr:hypothetical protein [Bacillota bacterium]